MFKLLIDLEIAMEISGLNHQSQSFILFINVKMPTNVGILTFMSRINFMLSWVKSEKRFITTGPGSVLFASSFWSFT